MRLIKFLVVLVLAAVIALIGYAYLGDMAPKQREIRNAIPVQGGELAPAAEAPAEPAAAAEGEATAAEAPATEAPASEAAPAEDAPAPITGEDTTEAPGD